MTLSFNDVLEAKKMISKNVIKTPLLRVPALDEVLNCKVYLKPESLQNTGSFKLRGALNALMNLSDKEKNRGVVASSSGNHAQGVAYAAKILGIKAKIIMPENANPIKLQSVKDFGAEVVLVDKDPMSREKKVREIVENEGLIEVHPYKNTFVQAGQGTMVLEILEDNKNINKIIAPIGGGGLISGVSTAVKNSNRDIEVIGVEPENLRRYYKAINENKIEKISGETIADGTRNNIADENILEIIRKNVDNLTFASDSDIKTAMNLLLKVGKIVIEPSSALVFGAVLNKEIKLDSKYNVCFVISGGNNDIKLLNEIISEGLNEKL